MLDQKEQDASDSYRQLLATDSFGNLFALDISNDDLKPNTLKGVYFLNHERDFETDYIVASGLIPFIFFIIHYETKEPSVPFFWPFNKEMMLLHDPDLTSSAWRSRLPWES